MSNKELLDSIKKLRELTGVGFKDCKIALDETQGDIEKSIDFLRKKGVNLFNLSSIIGYHMIEEQYDLLTKNADMQQIVDKLGKIDIKDKKTIAIYQNLNGYTELYHLLYAKNVKGAAAKLLIYDTGPDGRHTGWKQEYIGIFDPKKNQLKEVKGDPLTSKYNC